MGRDMEWESSKWTDRNMFVAHFFPCSGLSVVGLFHYGLLNSHTRAGKWQIPWPKRQRPTRLRCWMKIQNNKPKSKQCDAISLWILAYFSFEIQRAMSYDSLKTIDRRHNWQFQCTHTRVLARPLKQKVSNASGASTSKQCFRLIFFCFHFSRYWCRKC